MADSKHRTDGAGDGGGAVPPPAAPLTQGATAAPLVSTKAFVHPRNWLDYHKFMASVDLEGIFRSFGGGPPVVLGEMPNLAHPVFTWPSPELLDLIKEHIAPIPDSPLNCPFTIYVNGKAEL